MNAPNKSQDAAGTSRHAHPRFSSNSSRASSLEHVYPKPQRAPPPPPNDHSEARSGYSNTASMHSIGSGSSRATHPRRGSLSRPSTRHGSDTFTQPYVSQSARELIEFLDEGPPAGDATSSPAVAAPTTPKKSTGLSYFPERIRKISRKQRASGTTNESEEALEISSPIGKLPKTAVSPPVRELIDFLDEGPSPTSDDLDASPSSSKTSSPNGGAFLGKLQALGRNGGRRTKPNGLSIGVPDRTSHPEPRLSPQSPGSRSDKSQPYISRSARELVNFLDEGPPPEVRKRHRGESSASAEAARSMSSLQRLRGMLSRGPGGNSPEGSSETELLISDPSQRSSVASSLEMFMLPIPGVFDDSGSPAISPSEAPQVVQHKSPEESALPHAPSAAEVSSSEAEAAATENIVSHDVPSTSMQESAVVLRLDQQERPSVSAAAPIVLVISSLVLYMLLSTPLT